MNIVSKGSASRLAYVQRIVRAAALPCRVDATDTPFQRLAAVSPNEAAVNARLASLGLEIMPPWEDAVDAYVERLVASPAWAERTAVQA